jgi:vesicle coat complex subunit
MQDQDLDVRGAAAAAVGHLGAAAATAPFLARLAELLQHQDGYVRDAAAEAIDELHAWGMRLFTGAYPDALPATAPTPPWPITGIPLDILSRLLP